MASLRTARELFAKASELAERGEWLEVAGLEVEAFKLAKESTAKGSAMFAYRMWNAALGAASAAQATAKDAGSRSKAAGMLEWLKLTDQTCREPVARLHALRLDRNVHRDGPIVWAAQNHEAARELERLEAIHGEG